MERDLELRKEPMSLVQPILVFVQLPIVNIADNVNIARLVTEFIIHYLGLAHVIL